MFADQDIENTSCVESSNYPLISKPIVEFGECSDVQEIGCHPCPPPRPPRKHCKPQICF